jgi:endonuclease/exonuclease/phosphatase family metal-dependent hydrolase
MFRIATYNIRYGGTGRMDLLLAVLKHIEADAILLTEASDENVLRAMSHALAMPYVKTEEGRAHVALLSHFPIVSWRSYRPPHIRRALLEIRLAPRPDVEIALYGLHLQPHYFAWNEQKRIRELSAYLQYIQSQTPAPHLLLGDFNAIAPGDRFPTDHLPQKERLMLLWEGGHVYRDALRMLSDRGYTDCFRVLHSGDDGFTLPTQFPQVRLDYMFADPRLAQSLKTCEVMKHPDEAVSASDHFPLVATFDL